MAGKTKAELNRDASGLTEMMRAFVRHMAAGETQTRAATLAGYGPKGCDTIGSRLARDPRIIAALEPEFERIEQQELVPQAYAALKRAMSANMPINMQIKAADIVLRHRKGKQGYETDPDNVTAKDLEMLIADLKAREARLVERAPVMIDVTPNVEQGSSGLFD